ncbi:uncharacterized protein [Amphiura filiformis]|uniref:uncharacterized protein n=1 Tax=Amphiura filiformis TaxID=82378 RepID=UPI003B215732
MLGMKTLVAYAAIVLALIVSTGTSEDIEDTEELQLPDELIDIKRVDPNYQELLSRLQRARENAALQGLDDKRMASGWKRAGMAGGWKRGQSAAAGWKRPANAAAGWKRGQALAGGWKRGQPAAAGWKRGQAAAAGWKRDYEPIEVDTRDGDAWRNNQMKAASGWKRTSAHLIQQNEEDEP